jgi:hypothetical protein
MYTTKKSILSGMEKMERNLTPYNRVARPASFR